MAKNYGKHIGYVLIKSKTYSCGASEMKVLYKDANVLVLRDWPNTPLPQYFLVAKELNDTAWKTAQNYMSTLNTGGIQISLLPQSVVTDFDAIVSTFMTIEQAKEWWENEKKAYEVFVAEKRKEQENTEK